MKCILTEKNINIHFTFFLFFSVITEKSIMTRFSIASKILIKFDFKSCLNTSKIRINTV